jgi:hypothetical protein
MTRPGEELARLGEQLRQVFSEERDAIGKLDHARLVTLTDTKRELVTRLAALRETAPRDAQLRTLFTTLHAEARANAMLASTANAAIRLLLGYEAAPSYDRRARPVTTGPSRILAAY